MIVTIEWIRTKYNKFNKLYFNNELPNIEFKISRSKHQWGYAGYMIKIKTGEVIPEYIAISNYYDSPEHVKETTLLHEMIHIKDYAQHPEHFYVGHRKNRYYDAHGIWFRNEAAKFIKFGYDIYKNVTDEEVLVSTLSESTKQNIERKKHTTRIVAFFGKNGKIWYCKTSQDNVTNIILKVKKQYSWWFNDELNGIETIKSFSTEAEKYVERRNCNTKLRGWMKTASAFEQECELCSFKFVRMYNYKLY